MSSATDELSIGMSDIPRDEPPATVDPAGNAVDFNPDIPGSTEEAPYGYFPDGRIRKRRPKGSGGGQRTTSNKMPGGRQAEQAAALLASFNDIFSLVFVAAGMPESAMTLKMNNAKFEEMAADALAADKKLCEKILSVGVTSGRAGLAVAYVRLGMNMYPSVKAEYQANHPKEIESYDD